MERCSLGIAAASVATPQHSSRRILSESHDQKIPQSRDTQTLGCKVVQSMFGNLGLPVWNVRSDNRQMPEVRYMVQEGIPGGPIREQHPARAANETERSLYH